MKNKLVIMCGYPYSGKTYLSKRLSQKYGFERVDIDDVIKTWGYDSFDGPRLTEEKLHEMFEQYYELIRSGLSAGKTVISDTSNPSRDRRFYLKSLAQEFGCQSITVFIEVSKELSLRRWGENAKHCIRMQISKKTLSDAFAEMESPNADENYIIYRPHTSLQKLYQKIFISG